MQLKKTSFKTYKIRELLVLLAFDFIDGNASEVCGCSHKTTGSVCSWRNIPNISGNMRYFRRITVT